ncbi:hypothetical protein LCGC14_0823670 [marine sediment metagenome]|uniref:Uncharacterized protein n=1 Tax=marine sediment metagenome TaxID=412755 RepID=A0A0F9PMN7_9ZZZZ
MLDQDIPVWYRFLDKYGFMFQKLYYDVFVGGPFYSAEKLKDPLIYMWRALNSKRIDALAELEKELWLIEVNTDPGLRAVGQLQVYLKLWQEDPKIDKPVQLVLVSAVVDPDLLSAASSLGIKPYIMPGSTSLTIPI